MVEGFAGALAAGESLTIGSNGRPGSREGRQKSEAGPDAGQERARTAMLPHPIRMGTASHQDTAGETPEENGDRGGTRTHDLTLKRRLLYR